MPSFDEEKVYLPIAERDLRYCFIPGKTRWATGRSIINLPPLRWYDTNMYYSFYF